MPSSAPLPGRKYSFCLRLVCFADLRACRVRFASAENCGKPGDHALVDHLYALFQRAHLRAALALVPAGRRALLDDEVFGLETLDDLSRRAVVDLCVMKSVNRGL